MYEEVLLKESVSQTKIPLGLNRWMLIAFSCFYIYFMGAMVVNWVPVEDMLKQGHAYEWACSSSDPPVKGYLCLQQREKLKLLGTLAQSFEFSGSCLAGILVDTFGPRTASAAGGLFFIIGYLFLAVSSSSVQLYVPSFIFQGLAIECCFFGLLSFPNLFPKHRSLTLAVLGTFRSVSFANSLIMKHMTYDTYTLKRTGFVFMGISMALAAIAFFVYPSKPFIVVEEAQRALETVSTHSLYAVHTDKSEAAPLKSSHKSSSMSTAAEDGGILTPVQEKKIEFAIFLKRLVGPFYLAWLVAFSCMYLRGGWYLITLSEQHPRVADAFSYIAIFSFVPCPLFGYIGDRFGMMVVLFILNLASTVMLVCLLSGSSLAAQWIAVILSCFMLSFLASENYCLIQQKYDEIGRGKLSGIAMLVSGLVQMVNNPLSNWGGRKKSYQAPNFVHLGLVAVGFSALGVMFMYRKTILDSTKMQRADLERRRRLRARVFYNRVQQQQQYGPTAGVEAAKEDV